MSTKPICEYSKATSANLIQCNSCKKKYDFYIMQFCGAIVDNTNLGMFTCPACMGATLPVLSEMPAKPESREFGNGEIEIIEIDDAEMDDSENSKPEIDYIYSLTRIEGEDDEELYSAFVKSKNISNIKNRSIELPISVLTKKESASYLDYLNRNKNKAFFTKEITEVSNCPGIHIEAVLAIDKNLMLVKWRGLDYTQASWENITFVSKNAPDLVTKFFAIEFQPRRPLPYSAKRGIVREPIVPSVLFACVGKKLLDFQKEGVAWLYEFYTKDKTCVLADDCGMGKTVQILSFASILCSQTPSFNVPVQLNRNHSAPFIIVCEKEMINHWKTESQIVVPHLNTIIYDGSRDNRNAIIKLLLFYYGSDRAKVAYPFPNPPNDYVADPNFWFPSEKLKFDILVVDTKSLMEDINFLIRFKWSCVVLDNRLNHLSKHLITSIDKFYFKIRRVMVSDGGDRFSNRDEIFNLTHFLNRKPWSKSQEESFASQLNVIQKAIIPYIRCAKRQNEKQGLDNIPRGLPNYVQDIFILCPLKPSQILLYNEEVDKKIENSDPSNYLLAQNLYKICISSLLINESEAPSKSDESPLQALLECSGKLQTLQFLLDSLLRRNERALVMCSNKEVTDLVQYFLNLDGYDCANVPDFKPTHPKTYAKLEGNDFEIKNIVTGTNARVVLSSSNEDISILAESYVTLPIRHVIFVQPFHVKGCDIIQFSLFIDKSNQKLEHPTFYNLIAPSTIDENVMKLSFKRQNFLFNPLSFHSLDRNSLFNLIGGKVKERDCSMSYNAASFEAMFPIMNPSKLENFKRNTGLQLMSNVPRFIFLNSTGDWRPVYDMPFIEIYNSNPKSESIINVSDNNQAYRQPMGGVAPLPKLTVGGAPEIICTKCLLSGHERRSCTESIEMFFDKDAGKLGISLSTEFEFSPQAIGKVSHSVFIKAIQPDGAAAKTAFKPGMLLLAVNGQSALTIDMEKILKLATARPITLVFLDLTYSSLANHASIRQIIIPQPTNMTRAPPNPSGSYRGRGGGMQTSGRGRGRGGGASVNYTPPSARRDNINTGVSKEGDYEVYEGRSKHVLDFESPPIKITLGSAGDQREQLGIRLTHPFDAENNELSVSAMVQGIVENHLASKNPLIKEGMVISRVNEVTTLDKTFEETKALVRAAGRPVTLEFITAIPNYKTFFSRFIIKKKSSNVSNLSIEKRVCDVCKKNPSLPLSMTDPSSQTDHQLWLDGFFQSSGVFTNSSDTWTSFYSKDGDRIMVKWVKETNTFTQTKVSEPLVGVLREALWDVITNQSINLGTIGIEIGISESVLKSFIYGNETDESVPVFTPKQRKIIADKLTSYIHNSDRMVGSCLSLYEKGGVYANNEYLQDKSCLCCGSTCKLNERDEKKGNMIKGVSLAHLMNEGHEELEL